MNRDVESIYTTTVNGKTYYFKCTDPGTHDGGKHFSGSVNVYEKGTDECFTVFVTVKSDEIDTYYDKIIDEIDKHVKG